LLLKDEVYNIVGCALEVINELGHGLLEKPYENAMAVELGLVGIPFRQQARFPVNYKEIQVGEYIPDLIVYDKVVIEIKTIEHIGNHEAGQMLNYLKISGLKVGVVLNFKHSKLEWKRFVL